MCSIFTFVWKIRLEETNHQIYILIFEEFWTTAPKENHENTEIQAVSPIRMALGKSGESFSNAGDFTLGDVSLTGLPVTTVCVSNFPWSPRHAVPSASQQLTNRKAGPSVFLAACARGTCDIERGSKHAEELANFERPAAHAGTPGCTTRRRPLSLRAENASQLEPLGANSCVL